MCYGHLLNRDKILILNLVAWFHTSKKRKEWNKFFMDIGMQHLHRRTCFSLSCPLPPSRSSHSLFQSCTLSLPLLVWTILHLCYLFQSLSFFLSLSLSLSLTLSLSFSLLLLCSLSLSSLTLSISLSHYLSLFTPAPFTKISMVMGPCAGGAVYSPAMTDFIFMVTSVEFATIYVTPFSNSMHNV